MKSLLFYSDTQGLLLCVLPDMSLLWSSSQPTVYEATLFDDEAGFLMLAYYIGLEKIPADGRLIEVEHEQNYRASIVECIHAGVPGWFAPSLQTVGSMQ